MKWRIRPEMTYREILTKAEQILCDRGIDEAKNDAWLLFEYVFKMARHEYFMKMNDAIPEDRKLYDEYLSCIERRGQRVPLQHITGCQEFMGLDFFVNESVLIPRQDTEILVEKALEKIELINTEKSKVHDSENIRFLDMCTGSGCIAVSLYSIARGRGMTGIEATAVDISKEALEVAVKNAKANNADDIKFVCSNLFQKFEENTDCGIGIKYDMIISNPPYIPSKDIDELMPEVKDFEPRLALDGTDDGLKFYKDITKESVKYIKNGGWLLYEIGFDQGEAVKNIMEQQGYEDVTVIKDLAGLDRVVSGKRTYN